jgi:transcriptional regulator with XRE-family HTH domain
MAEIEPAGEQENPRAETGQTPSIKTFLDRANRLFDLRCERDGRKYSPQEFADLIKAETGEDASHTSIWRIRTRRLPNTTLATVDILARFFGVPSAYFFPDFDEQAAKRIEAQLGLLTAMRKAGITSIAALGAMSPAALTIAHLANGVDPQTLNAIAELLSTARKAQGLPDKAESDPAPRPVKE